MIHPKETTSALLLLFLLSIQLIDSQNISELVAPVCKKKSIEYAIQVNLKDYLDKENNIDGREFYKSIEDLKDKSVGVFINIPLPDFSKVKEYTTYEDLLNGLRKHEVEAIIIDTSMANYTQLITNDLSLLPDKYGDAEIGYGCQKNSTFYQELDEYTRSHLEEIQNIHYKWMGISESENVIDTNLPGGNGVIKGMFVMEYPPFCYKDENGNPSCTEIEVLYNFAREKGYSLEIQETPSIDDPYDALKSGKINVTSFLQIELFKKEFSFPYFPGVGLNAIIRYSNSPESATWTTIYDKVEDFDGQVLGCLNGYSFEYLYKEKFPKSEIVYKKSNFDLLYILLMEEIQGFISDETIAINFEKKFPDRITYYLIDVYNNFGFGFKKTDDTLLQEFNEFLKTVDTDKLYEKWSSEDETKLIISTDIKGTKTIKAGFFSDIKPFSYDLNGVMKGLEIDLLYQFAKSKNYNVEFIQLSNSIERMNLDEYDITGGCFTITEEREKTISFSEPIFKVGTALIVRKGSKKDKIKLSLIDDEYNEIENNKATITLDMGDNTLESKCTFPDTFNDTILLNCKISDLKDIDPYSQGVKSLNSTDKLRILYSDLEFRNLLQANTKIGEKIIEESDKSEAICSEENRANEFPTIAVIGGGVAVAALIFALISCI